MCEPQKNHDFVLLSFCLRKHPENGVTGVKMTLVMSAHALAEGLMCFLWLGGMFVRSLM